MVENVNLPNMQQGIAPPVQPPSLVAALQSFITGSGIPHVPQALVQSPSGQLMTAIVLAANPKGQVFLQTPQGQVVFNSPVQLRVGQQLTLETLPRMPLPQQVPGAPPPPPAAMPLDVRLVRVNGVAAEQMFPDATKTPTHIQDTTSRNQQPLQQAASGLFLRAVFPQPTKLTQPNNANQTTSPFDAEAVEFEPSPLQSRASFRATVLSTPTQAQNTEVEAIAPIISAEADADVEADAEADEATQRETRQQQTPRSPFAQLKAGDTLTLKITGGTLPASATSAATVTATAENAAPQQSSLPLLTTAFTEAKNPAMPLPSPAAAMVPPAATTQPASAEIAASIITTEGSDAEAADADVIPPAPPSSTSTKPATATPLTPPTPPSPNALAGTVIAQEADGSAIVQTPAGVLRLSPDVPLPRGTQLMLDVKEIRPALDAYAASQLPPAFQTGNPAKDALVKGMTALDMLFKQVFGMNADTAKEMAHELIPEPGRQFGNKVLEFMANVKQDSLPENIRHILPKEVVEQLGLNRTASEFTGLKTAMADAPPPQWSFMLIPVMRGDEMHHMRWFKRKQERDEGQGDNEGEGTRFVVELETKSLGQIQFDGLFLNQTTKEKEFDLIIRSQKGFNEEEQQQIADIYNNYGQISGYRGSLRFEETSRFPVQPLNDIITRESREISV